MTELEQIELRQVLDDMRLKWRDFEIDESKPSRLRASFFGYVFGPALLFGLLSGILAAGMLSLTAVVLSYMTTEVAQDAFDIIIASGTASVAAVVMAYAAVYLIEDWRDLQWETKTRRYFGQPQRERPTVRYYDQTSSSQIVGSVIDWHLRWKELLARRVYDERGQWIGGQSAVRDKHFGPSRSLDQPQLYTNVTGMWEEVRMYLVKIEYINNIEECYWTEKAKGELLARLRIV